MGGDAQPSEAQAIATIHAALDAGITLIDTANIYAPNWESIGHNERLVAKALKAYGGRPENVVVATKGGITRASGELWGRNGTASHLREAVHRSLRALEVDVIDLYYWHRPDRSLRYAEVIATFADLKRDGLIKEIGISNANVEEIDVAIEVLGEGELAAVQNEFSPKFNDTSKPELDFCADNGIAFVPWSPLGGTGGGAAKVGTKFPVIGQIADELGVSPQQVTLAWELSLGNHVIPIPGASRPASVLDSAKAMTLALTQDQSDLISDAVL